MMVSPVSALHTPTGRNYPVLPSTCDPSSESRISITMAHPVRVCNSNGTTPCFRRDCAAGWLSLADIDRPHFATDTKTPLTKAGSPQMNRMFRQTLFLTVACLALPAAAQTPPTQAGHRTGRRPRPRHRHSPPSLRHRRPQPRRRRPPEPPLLERPSVPRRRSLFPSGSSKSTSTRRARSPAPTS